MEIQTKQISLANNGGTVVLTAAVCTVTGMSERADRFYGNIAIAFERSVRERMYAEAVAAYDASPDRRKRYRFEPLKASLCLSESNSCVTMQTIINGEIVINERHIWKDGLMLKRIQVKNNDQKRTLAR